MIRGELFKSSRTDDTLFARVRSRLAAALSGAAGAQRYDSLRPVLPLGGFDPLTLFANGEQGVWFDPNDLSTLFQNSAGTVPVTAAGQPVGLMLDKSGRGHHVSFGDGPARPFLQRNVATAAFYLEPDGVDDGGATAPINFTGTDKVSVFAGIRKLSDASSALLELSALIGANNGTFLLQPQASNAYGWFSKGTALAAAIGPANTPAPNTAVIAAFGNISGDSAILRINGAQVAQSGVDQGAGTYGNYPLYLFRRGGMTLPWVGHFYGCVIVGRPTTEPETLEVNRMYARRAGVMLT